LKRGRNYWEETVVGVDFGPGKKNLTGGSRCQWGKKKRGCTGSG
jgi:hypothetical protein